MEKGRQCGVDINLLVSWTGQLKIKTLPWNSIGLIPSSVNWRSCKFLTRGYEMTIKRPNTSKALWAPGIWWALSKRAYGCAVEWRWWRRQGGPKTYLWLILRIRGIICVQWNGSILSPGEPWWTCTLQGPGMEDFIIPKSPSSANCSSSLAMTAP